MKIALVHDALHTWGGAERVLAALCDAFPRAPLYTLTFDPKVAAALKTRVTGSFLQRLPAGLRHQWWTLPFRSIAPETFDLSEYDVVLTSSSAFAKGIVTRPSTLHICYCHTPTRFLWHDAPTLALTYPPGTVRRGLSLLTLHALRLWDHAAARRVDHFIANSAATRSRIRKYYGRDATVIYPPVDLSRFATMGEPLPDQQARSYFLFVGRLSPYKRADLVIETFNKLQLPLIVAGAGREYSRLARLAGATVSLRGFVGDADLPSLYRGARAVIFPSDDDLGLVPLEALASGTPVIALRRGGATETITEGVTGEFFDEPVEELLADGVRRFLDKEGMVKPDALRAQAYRFSAARFRAEIRDLVGTAWENWRQAPGA